MIINKSIITALILSLLHAPSPAIAHSGNKDPLTLFEKETIEFSEVSQADQDYYNLFEGTQNPLSEFTITIAWKTSYNQALM